MHKSKNDGSRSQQARTSSPAPARLEPIHPKTEQSGKLYGDLTKLPVAEVERELTIKLLSLINSSNQIHELMKLVTVFLKDWSGCEAVGIRLQDGEDFPYFETSGFSKEFVQAESKLCSVNEIGEVIRDSRGRPFLECMCGNIIGGRFDPSKPFFTPHGSFWSNCTTDLLADTSNDDRLAKTRNRCSAAGYESVALIPLRTGKETFGLLQFNSKQKNRFSAEKIAMLERLADNLAIGLAQRRADEAMRKSETKFRSLFENMTEGFAHCKILLDEQGKPADFVYLDVNDAFEKLTGLKNVIGKKVTEVLSGVKDLNPELFEIYGRVALTGRPERFETYLPSLGIWFIISSYSPQKGHFVAVFENITRRKFAEQSLGEKNRLNQLLLDAMPCVALLLRPGSREIVALNKAAVEAGAVVGWTCFETWTGNQTPCPWCLAPQAWATGQAQHLVVEHEGIWWDAHWIPISDDLYMHYAFDITEQKKAVESLHASETRFRELFKNMSNGVAVYEAVDDGNDFVIKDFNGAAQRIEKISKESVAGKRVTEVFPGVKEMGMLDVLRRVWKTGKAEKYPATIYKDSRISGWRENYIYKLPSGEIVAVYDDVTEQKLAEDRLQEDRNLLRALIDHIPDKVYIKDKDSRFLVCNKTTSQYWQAADKGDIIGKTDFDLYGPAQAKVFYDEEQNLMRTGEPIINVGDRYTDYAGEVRYVLTSKVPLRDSHGNVTGLLGIHRDITERRLAEERLEQERNLLRTLIDQIPEDIYVKDKDSRFIICNKGVTGFWASQGKENITGKTDFDVFEPAEAQKYFDEEQTIIRTGKPVINREGQVALKNGKIHRCLTSKLPLRDNLGNIVGIVGINRDITERKQTEEILLGYQKQLKRLASQLALTEERQRRKIAAGLHDEVSQSLALAKIKLDTLQSSLSGNKAVSEIEQISNALEKAIQDTRDLTFELSNPILYELGLEAAVAEWLNEKLHVKHGIDVFFEDDGSVKPLEDDVRVLLFRNIRELLINIIKHAKADKVRVRIGRINGSIEVTVEDNGIGFDHATRKAGFGLLSIRESIQQLGGRYEIESKPGAGCKVIMTAPLKGQSRKKEE